MHAVVKKELEGKEWNIVKLYKEKVVHPNEAEVEEHFAIIDAPLGWWFVGIRWLLIDEVYACGVLYIVHVHGETRNAPYLAGGDMAEIDRCLQRFLVGPLSLHLDDCVSGLIMGTGDVPDPSMSTYHQSPSVWASVANDLTDVEVMEGAFGFTPDEVHELACEYKVLGVESGLEARTFVSDLDKSYSMREVLEEVGRHCQEQHVDTEMQNLCLY
ncbi:hypothetical protein EDD18DRAFT_1426793 [Armillaria luteobubalina]|uniref:Uncharacterized protein n=1 Tax=Armillaria luteobubalina TaxID=153913 RepID=A0AA39QFU4_9AGAR|nr:hypothetical protein EDD18DRAFT_1426793 [Armillaria luteobubalina]